MSCISVSKNPLYAQKIQFKIKWNYILPFEKKRISFFSRVFIQSDRFLRFDILHAFVGSLGSFVLHSDFMILKNYPKKLYYKGKFNSKIFFPQFSNFKSSWLFYILRAKQIDSSWICKKHKQLLVSCNTKYFKIIWLYNKARLHTIKLVDSHNTQIVLNILNISVKKFSNKIFKNNLKGWTEAKQDVFLKSLSQ